MTKFTLVNPKIDGSIKTAFEASSPLKAADEAYSTVSKYFTNSVPLFRFTLQSGGKFHHFTVTEKLGKDKKVSYAIKEFKGKVNMDAFEKQIKDYEKQHGGKHRKLDDSDSSDSDSDSPIFRTYNYPIYNWWYDPFIYVVNDKEQADKLAKALSPIMYIPGIAAPGINAIAYPWYLGPVWTVN